MHIITGGAGFIGSAFAAKLNSCGINDIIIVDEVGSTGGNLQKLKFTDYIHKDSFLDLINHNKLDGKISSIVHMGACSSTTETNVDYLLKNNFLYTKSLAEYCIAKRIRFIYASSAATYGNGSLGYSDSDDVSLKLSPLNPYGLSKSLLDNWAISSNVQKQITGIKFFNVFGPNEYHKGDMRSVVFKAYEQIKSSGSVKLFKSYNSKFRDGEQMRDFIYIKDCADVLFWFLQNPEKNGIFNLGTGKARTWNDLVTSVFSALDLKPKIEYIDMPEQLRTQYQYFTEAKMDKLRSAGYTTPFASLEDTVKDYVKTYLENTDRYL